MTAPLSRWRAAVERFHRLSEAGDAFEAAAAVSALRSPYSGRKEVAAVVARPRLLRSYEVRRELAGHARSPEALALRFVGGLYWRDLLAVARDVRSRPLVRRAAENAIRARLAGLAVGERVAIARLATSGVLPGLRHDPSKRVIAALLENARLTEGGLLPLVSSERARPRILVLVAGNARWGARYAIRAALARNPRTPAATALDLLSGLRRRDLEAVLADPRLAHPQRRRAALLLGREQPEAAAAPA